MSRWPTLTLLAWLLVTSCTDATRLSGAAVNTSGSGDTASSDEAPGDQHVTDVSVHVHDDVATFLVVRWRQVVESSGTRVDFRFDDDWRSTPPQPGTVGEHEALLVGAPADTTVTLHVVNTTPTGDVLSAPYIASTGPLPPDMPRPTLVNFDAELASPHRWLLGSVEATQAPDTYYAGPFWLYVVDRQARVVWYYVDRSTDDTMAFPRIGPDGAHIIVERRKFGAGNYNPTVRRLTLDGGVFEEIPVPGLSDCFDVMPDGTVLFNTVRFEDKSALKERRPDGSIREIWDCSKWGKDLQLGTCYSNTVDWHPQTDSVTLSFPYSGVAVEIDRVTGELLSQWGKVDGSWSFEPEDWAFQFNHFVHFTDQGTLLVSSHPPDIEHDSGPGAHTFVEFDVDRANRRLVKRWLFDDNDGWPKYKGMASRLDNGNTLANYGTGGTIIEVTPAGKTVWEIKWDADFDEPHLDNMVGHNILIDDLYALTSVARP